MSEDKEDPEKPTEAKKFYESNAGDGTTVHDQYLSGIPLILAVFSCASCMFLMALDQTIVVTLLKTVGEKFHSYEKVGWLTSGFMVALAVSALAWGKIAQIFGRKITMITAVVLFEAGSLLSALAPSMNALIGGRVLSGIGGGGIQSLSMVIISEVAPIHMRSLMFTCLNLIVSVSTTGGPLIGGAFTENVTWRWCFYINLPIGGMSLLCLICFFNPPKTKGSIKEKIFLIDYIGNSLIAAAIVLLLLALSFGGNNYPWRSGPVISLFVLSGVLFIAFGVWNFKYSKNPIILLSLVKTVGVMAPAITIFLSYFSFTSTSVFLATYFQVVRQASPFRSGVDFLPLIIAAFCTGITLGILIKKTRYVKPFSILGGIAGCVGFGCLSLLNANSSQSERIGLLILPGIYMGTLLQTCMISSQLSAPKEDGATILATTLMSFSRAFGGTLGALTAQLVYDSSFSQKLHEAVKKHQDLFSNVSESVLSEMKSQPQFINQLSTSQKTIVIDVVMKSVRNVFTMVVSAVCFGFLVMMFSTNKRIPKRKDIKSKEDVDREGKEEPEIKEPEIQDPEIQDPEITKSEERKETEEKQLVQQHTKEQEQK